MGFELIAACGLDLLLGDPVWFPHPVKAIGYALVKLERFFRRSNLSLRLAGILCNLIMVIMTYSLVWLACRLAGGLYPDLGTAISVLFIFMSLSMRSLAQAAKKIYLPLKEGDLDSARLYLGQIVSRETASLDGDDLIRGAVESVAENTVDGVISPLFYAWLGGPALAWAYKAVNTLDSMIGYKNERYLDFGWFSARLDDAANFIPARLSAFMIPLAAFLIGLDAPSSLKTVRADGRKAASLNSGFPEAAFAGALRIQLGGVSVYGGQVANNAFIGCSLQPKKVEHINQAIRLMYAASLVTLLLMTMTMIAGGMFMK